MNIRELINEAKERCPQCGMTDCTCAPGKCKCKPIAGWIPNKGFKKQNVAEGDSGNKYKVKSIGYDSKGDYYISPSTGKKVYKQANKGDHENPKTGEIKKKVSEDHEIQMADSELKSIYHNSRKLLRLIKHYSEQEGLEAWQQSKITKAADYLNSVLQAVSGQQTR
jgi:hypothetical protein